MDLAFNNLQRLICHKTKQNEQNNQIKLFWNCCYISFQNMKSFFEFLVSVINYYHIIGLRLFWVSFEWFRRQVSCDANYFFLSCRKYYDRGLIVSIRLYGCTTWVLTKQMEKKLDGNYKRLLRAILNKSWRKHPTKKQLYGHRPPITKTIKIRRTRHAGHCGRNKDEIVSDVLLWTPSHHRAKAGRSVRTYLK